jgi:hypothetical protein
MLTDALIEKMVADADTMARRFTLAAPFDVREKTELAETFDADIALIASAASSRR